MSDQEVSQSRDIWPHSHDITSGNLIYSGAKYKAEKDGIGLLTGFRKVKMFRCSVCLKDVEEVDSEIFLPGEY